MRPKFVAVAALAAAAFAQNNTLVPVVSKAVSRTIDLPGEIQPYLSVAIHAKVSGYLERITVDRGSSVKAGELIAELRAPELQAQIAEAESKVQGAESDRAQAEAQLNAAQSTYDRLKKASETPGAIAGNELIQAEQQVDAAKAVVRARAQAVAAARNAVQAQKDVQAYLRITAPFDGVVTERMAHPGALVGPNSEALVTIEQVSRLRIIVPVPEQNLGGLTHGASVGFRVPAYPERVYTGTVARSAHVVDPKTRTMAVELDAVNRDGSLAPGMYPTIKWPVHTGSAALWVPRTAVVTTSERTFVIRERGGHAEWVDVKKGAADGDLVEVSGNLHAGDRVVRRATDEIREGAAIR
jgi:membrane fusion protein, multidrug efflux system